MKIYPVIHQYEVCDERWAVLERHDVVAVFESMEDAQAVCDMYSNPHVYDLSMGLCEGTLVFREYDVIPHAGFSPENIAGILAQEKDKNGVEYREEFVYYWRFFCEKYRTRVQNGCTTEWFCVGYVGEEFPDGTPIEEIVSFFDRHYPGGIENLVNDAGIEWEEIK